MLLMFAIGVILLGYFDNCFNDFSYLFKTVTGLLIKFLMLLVQWGKLTLGILVLFRLLRRTGGLTGTVISVF